MFQKKGFRNLAFFGIEKLEWSVARLASFEKRAGQWGAAFYSYLLKGNERDVLSHNFGELISWLKGLPRPTGILCCNDDFGQILINACSMAGIKVPHEIAVLGIDNDELICNITYPNLSSISRNHYQTANTICTMLSDLMNGKQPGEKVILTEAAEVIERASTDTVAVEDEEVTRAISYITANLGKQLGVAEVAAQGALSIKALNNRFKVATGHSIHEEIQLRRLSRFKQLLLDNKSIKEIAFALGFPDDSHISRWFSNLEGQSPIEWKKKFSEHFQPGSQTSVHRSHRD
ncbi:substrate-binding domain-containing protein [Arcticibacter sp. MXS-1]|uniref:substrate-binding domain-containing protein n=1 Tax=Arcticibacter sp. MXS-1 TaxID=3341726 RepID=UPI0035A8F519